MIIRDKWIYFKLYRDIDKKHKTQIWEVFSSYDVYLGLIKWKGHWRTYSFYPETNTIYEDDCLIAIANFIKRLMDEREQ